MCIIIMKLWRCVDNVVEMMPIIYIWMWQPLSIWNKRFSALFLLSLFIFVADFFLFWLFEHVEMKSNKKYGDVGQIINFVWQVMCMPLCKISLEVSFWLVFIEMKFFAELATNRRNINFDNYYTFQRNMLFSLLFRWVSKLFHQILFMFTVSVGWIRHFHVFAFIYSNFVYELWSMINYCVSVHFQLLCYKYKYMRSQKIKKKVDCLLLD